MSLRRWMGGSLLLASSMLFAATSDASWSLDASGSYLSFVTTKNSDVAEAHAFIGLRGEVSDSGAAELTIEMASVHTLVPVRDERMRDVLFEAGKFPLATFSTEIDLEPLLAMAPGETRTTELVGQLDLHGVATTTRADVAVTRIGENRFSVVTRKPVVVLAATHA
ncbi:MAG: YceI family protein, partial [Gammaproteobacteria bacterium]